MTKLAQVYAVQQPASVFSPTSDSLQGHPGIVKLLRCNSTQLVLPKLRSFSHWGLPREHIRTLLQQLLQALEWLHSRGIVHRDIAPPNLMLDDDRIVIIDFGSACMMPC